MMNARFYSFLKVCSLALLTTQAFALEANQARWDGFYAGLGMGGVQNNTEMQTWVVPGGTYFGDAQDAPQLAALAKHNSSLGSFSGSFFGGYGHQFGNFLLGAEASINNLSLNESRSVSQRFDTDPSILFVVNQSLKADWQETLRVKLGFAQSRWIAYVTGGPAMTYVKYKSLYSDDNEQPGSGNPGASGTGTTSKMQYGWTVGGGGEYALNNAWSIKLEYLYADFGSATTHYPIIPTPTLSEFSSAMDAKATLNTQSLLLGLAYRF